MGETPIKLTLKAARINAGLSQKEAGKRLGVSENVISNWERGISFPDVIQLAAIEKTYHISYNNLIFLPK
jgi:putative transcriptional regulator